MDLQNWVKQNMKQSTSKPKSQVPGPEFPCSSCSKICKSLSGLKRHIQTRHNEKEVPKCEDPVLEEPKQIQKEPNKETQIPSPKTKEELALIIEQKLRSYNSKPPEVEVDDNPRKKYIIDLTTNKKYVYNNLQRGEFAFTEDGELSFTIFYSEYDGNIPSAELGLPTANLEYSNQIYYSNVEYLRSIPQETDHDLPVDQGDPEDDQETDHELPDDQGDPEDDQETDNDLPDDQGDPEGDQETDDELPDDQGDPESNQETDNDLSDDQGDPESNQETDNDLPDDQGDPEGDEETDNDLPDVQSQEAYHHDNQDSNIKDITN